MQPFRFDINLTRGFNHCGKIIFCNKKELKTPLYWFGLSIIESKEFQLNVFKQSKIEAFLSNVYDLYYLDKNKERESLIKNLQKLNLGHKMDSGGYQLMKARMKGSSKNLNLNPEMVLDKQLEIGCDCGVQLDFPFGPDLTKAEKIKRLNKTLKNLQELIKLIESYDINFSFLPVIHTVSDDFNFLNYGLKKIENILGEVPKQIGVGSLVPLVMRNIKATKSNNIVSLIYHLICIRKILPNSFIHTFGIGGTMTYLAILTGIDSFDSNGWIQKSAYGVIQLPGISDRYLKKEKHNRPFLINNRKQKNCKKPINEIDIFMKCKCLACKPFFKEDWNNKDWIFKQKAFIGRDQKAKTLRAIHNVSLYQNEMIKIRKAIRSNELENFVKNRLKMSIYYRYIDIILKSKNLEELPNFKRYLKFLK